MSFQIRQGLFKLDFTDHYAILGIPLDADAKQIRLRYLKIAQKLHPDTCKAENEEEKHRANQIFSKLVNPAYEALCKNSSLAEYQLLLSQIGQRLAEESEQLAIASETAKKLAQAGANWNAAYHDLLEALAAEQYQSLDEVLIKIAQISELNMVYLAVKHRQEQQQPIYRQSQPPAMKRTDPRTDGTPTRQTAQDNNPQASEKSEEQTKEARLAAYIRRAQESIERGKFAEAILELRDALKLDPNHSTCHGWMGLAYLKQNQLGMAKVHINKACQSNPRDPVAIQARQELDQLTPKENKTRSLGSGIFTGLFGGKKK